MTAAAAQLDVSIATDELPSGISFILLQHYTDLKLHFQCGLSYSIEGLRIDSGTPELLFLTSLSDKAMVKRFHKDFESCASDPAEALRAIDSHISDDYYYARFSPLAPSLYRKFVHDRPYIGGSEGLTMLANQLPPVLHRDRVELLEILRAAASLCEAVSLLHNRQILHNNINPHISYWLHDSVVLRGRCLTNILSDQGREVLEEEAWGQNLLPYLSPESSGRISLQPDFRSDVYSVGCTIYELLVGRPPLIAGDMLSFIHRHLTITPEPIHKLSPELPEELSYILAKCMEKSPDSRYQSIAGLKYDLEDFCMKMSEDTLKTFRIGTLDDLMRFKVTQSLCGRDRELAVLKHAWERVTETSNTAVVVLSGPSGIGKSQLIDELVQNSNAALFASAKYQQHRQGLPYKVLFEALQNLVRQVLSNNQREVRKWRLKLLERADLVSVIAENVPEIRLLLGDTEVEELAAAVPHEVKRRIHAAFVYTLRILAKDRSLIFVQDDIQWAGHGEIELIAEIATNVPNLMLLLAQRYMSSSDQTSFAVDTLRAIEVAVTEIELGNLSEDDVCEIVERTLNEEKSSNLAILARFVHAKTDGNPFFVTQMLQHLYRSGKIYFHIPNRRWRFDLKGIASDSLSPDIIEMIISQMKNLAQPMQTMLVSAAALGQERFSSEVLSCVLGQSLEDTRTQMRLAVDHNIFKIATDHDGIIVSSSTNSPELFAFLHDRTQEAAYALASPDNQAEVHHNIACNMLDRGPNLSELHESEIFVLANQLNRCMGIQSPTEREHALECNILAGRAALNVGDTSSALYYLQVAEHISEKHQNDLDTRLRIRFASIDARFASNAYQQVLELVKITRPHCETPKNITRLCLSELQAYTALGQLERAIEVGFAGLNSLQMPVPATDTVAEAFTAKLVKDLDHDVDSIAKLSGHPPLSIERFKLVQEILSLVVLPVYMVRPGLLASLCYLSVSITTRHGPSLEGAYPAMMLGAYLSSVGGRGNLLLSNAYGKFALELLAKADSTYPLTPGMYHLYAGHIAVFHKPVSEVVKYEDLAVSSGKALYNVEYTVFSLVEKPIFLSWSGQGLHQTLKELQETKDYILKTKSEASDCFLAVHMYGVSKLAGQDSEALEISHFLSAEDPGLAIQAGLSKTHAFMWELWRLIDSVMLRDMALSREVIGRCFSNIEGVLGTYYAAMAYYLAAVALLAMQCMSIAILSSERAIVDRAQSMIREYAEFAPSTFRTKIDFLNILSSRLGPHDRLDILDKYDNALDEAVKSGCYLDQALLSESAFRFLVDVPRRSKVYLNSCYAVHTAWGCQTKISLLENEFPWLKTEASVRLDRPVLRAYTETTESRYTRPAPSNQEKGGLHRTHFSVDSHTGPPSSATESQGGYSAVQLSSSAVEAVPVFTGSYRENKHLSELDIKTVLSASIQISQGTKVEDVLESLMKTVLLAAGADYGVLALYGLKEANAEDLMIHMHADVEKLHSMKHVHAMSRPDLLPISVVKTVLATQTSIIRDDSQDNLFDRTFARDRYYLARGRSLKSVLCMPIPSTDQSRPRGILYLENSATASAFTQQRLECLTLLCTQSAMTLERASVYQEMRTAMRQAEEATAQKSTFLANMSHEIRTPFNALLSCAIFLLDTSLTQVQKDYVSTIRDSATLTLSIIDGILDFSKIEQGMTDIVLDQFSITENIEGAMQVTAQKASRAGVDLVYSMQHEIDHVVGDAHHLRQVILNLIGNAVKFTSKGYVKVSSMTIGEIKDSQQTISITVEDTGIGISPRGIERLFKAFSQVDASINRSYGGTGLGLAISKKLIELMGGSVCVESVEGRGTKFFLEFPVQVIQTTNEANGPMAIKSSSEIKKQGRLALVISRFQATADVLGDDLTAIGLIIDKNTEILDPDLIAKAARAKPYSILFVDLQVDGALDLVASLQGILYSAESHYKIVILTHHGLNIPKDMSPKRIIGYLMKPITKAKLKEVVSSALHKIGTLEDEGSINALGRESESPALTHGKENNVAGKHKSKQLRILLAEDNIINTKVALQHLKRLGYSNVVHAKDGVEVLEYCQKAATARSMFDIILMDVQMPRLDGIGATEELIRQYPEAAARPVIIALTANATSTDKEKCLAAGMNGHCAKPILPDELSRTLSSVHRRPSIDHN